MAHNFDNIKDFADLENRLRNWENFGTEFMYDANGMIYLLKACLDSIVKNENEVDGYLTPQKLKLIHELAVALQTDDHEEE